MISSMTAVPDPSSVAPGDPKVVSKCELTRMALSSQGRRFPCISLVSPGHDNLTMMLVMLV